MTYALIILFFSDGFGTALNSQRIDGYQSLDECKWAAVEAKVNWSASSEWKPPIAFCVPLPKVKSNG